jgi:wobble nucleotide-excising tRNase
MIKRVQSIKNLGVFQDYKFNGNIQEFNDKNIIYGWNYSGKTTLSRLFSFLEKKEIPQEYSDVEFDIKLENNTSINQQNVGNCPFIVKVFNSEFIRENLRFDSIDKKMKGITFDVGESAHLRPIIEKNESDIEALSDKIKKFSININKNNDFESNFTAQAGKIKNDYFNSLIEFNKGHLKKIIPANESDLSNYIIQDPKIVQKIKLDSIAQNDKNKIESLKSKSRYNELFENAKLALEFEPPKVNGDQLLESDTELYDWAKKGLTYHEVKGLKRCAFCNGILEQERVVNLNSFFTNEAAKLRESINGIKREINQEKEHFETLDWSKISKNDISGSLQPQFEELLSAYPIIKQDYENLLNKLIAKLDAKLENSLFIKTDIGTIESTANVKLEEWINSVETIFNEHKNLIDNFKKNQDSSREKYQKHLVALFLQEIKYFEVQRKSKTEQRLHQIYRSIITRKKNENQTHRNKLKSITAGMAEMNIFIKRFLHRDDILIDVTEDDYFILKRGPKVAQNLSEGEKTAIAFSHFMVMLESLYVDKTLKETVIFIDDPISSLDANHIAEVSSLINSFFFRKEEVPNDPTKKIIVNCFKQLFISTHNFDFYSFLRDANNIKKKKHIEDKGEKKEVPSCHYYFIKKMSKDKSDIIKMPSHLIRYKSEYVYLFSIIYAYYESGCPTEGDNIILLPNAIRRFLEIYTLFKLPGIEGEIDNRIKELVGEVNELKVLHHFSHFTTFEKATKHDELILKLPDIADDTFILLRKDDKHYESLCKAINKSVI